MHVGKSKYEYKEVYKSYRYQKRALKKALKEGVAAFFFDPGLGKTKPAIDYMNIKSLSLAGRQKFKVLVVCPVSAVAVWEEEIVKHTRKPYRDKIKWEIITYDRAKTRIPELKRYGFNGVIMDESHYIGDHSTKRSQAMHRLGDSIKTNKIILTGTPEPTKMYSQYRVLDKNIFGPRWNFFRDEFLIMGGYYGKNIVGIRKPKKLSHLIKRVAVRVKKGKGETPEKVWQIIPVELSDKSKRIYQKMADKAVVEFKSGRISTASIGAVKMMRFQQITSGFLVDEEGGIISLAEEKLNILRSLLETTLNNKKVVIFARFRRDIRKIKEVCNKQGLNPLVIRGGVTTKKREKRRKLFNNPESKHKAMIIQIRSAQSIDLTGAHIGIYYSMDFSLVNFIQSQDRINRVNQDDTCVYYVLACKDTVDYSVYKMLKNKVKISDIIFSRYEEIIGGKLMLKRKFYRKEM